MFLIRIPNDFAADAMQYATALIILQTIQGITTLSKVTVLLEGATATISLRTNQSHIVDERENVEAHGNRLTATPKLSPEDQEALMKWPYAYGMPIFPADSINKRISLNGWPTFDFCKTDFRKEMLEGKYDDGAAARTGRTLKGDLYAVALDFDGWDAVVAWFETWERVLALAQKTLIEWHQDKGKIHVLIFTKEPLQNKKIHIGPNKVLLEIRCEKMPLFISPSRHRDGNKYAPLGVDKIETLDNTGLMKLKSQISLLSEKYMSDEDKSKYDAWLDEPDTILGEGAGRHDATKFKVCSYYWKYEGEWLNLSDDERFERVWQWHLRHCKPHRSRQEFDAICKWVISNHKEKRDAQHNEIKEFSRKNKNKIKNEGEEDPDIIEIATKVILSRYTFATVEESDQIYWYRDGVYVSGGEVKIKKLCEKLYGFDLNIRQRAEIREHIRCKTYHKLADFDSNIDIINVKNGLYNLQTNTLTPHSPEYLSLKQCPIRYDPKAKPRIFGRFIREIVYFEDIRSLYELMAYTFYRANPFEVIVILLGDGSNGKSVLFGVLTALHGEGNVSNVSIRTMLERPFALYDFLGKNCNLDAELSTGKIDDTATLKKITGQQLVRVEQKNQKAFDARIYAKLWLSANKIPYSSDQTNAWYRRNIIIATPNTFDVKKDPMQGIKKMDITLLDKLTTDEELSGIFNVLMKHLRRVLKNKEIYVNARSIEERRVKYQLAADPISAFINEAINPVIDPEVERNTIKDAMYIAYSQFCSIKKIGAIKKEAFGKALSKRFEWKDDSQRYQGKVYRVWVDRKLTPEYEKIAQDAIMRIRQKYGQETLDANIKVPSFGSV
jgi:putative DNA primase/helicase